MAAILTVIVPNRSPMNPRGLIAIAAQLAFALATNSSASTRENLFASRRLVIAYNTMSTTDESVLVGHTNGLGTPQQPRGDPMAKSSEPLPSDTPRKDDAMAKDTASTEISAYNEFPALEPPATSQQSVVNPASTLPTETHGQRMKPAVPNLPPSASRSTTAGKLDNQKLEDSSDSLKKEQGRVDSKQKSKVLARNLDGPSDEAVVKEATVQEENQQVTRGEPESVLPDTTGKRQRPTKLDIPATKRVTQLGDKLATESSRPSQPSSSADRPKDVPSSESRPATPSTAVSQSSAPPPSKQPRTLRVVSTPKIDSAQKLVPTSSDPTAKGSRARSKQSGSRETKASSNQAKAPVLETSYDSGSVTSTPISRPVSPDRKRARESTIKKPREAKKSESKINKESDEGKLDEPASSQATPVIQEPIVGRKKKSRKPKVLSSLQESGDGYSDSPLETPGAAPTATLPDEQVASSAAGTPTTSRLTESPKEVLPDIQRPQVDSDAPLERRDPVTSTLPGKPKISAAALYGDLIKQGRIDSEALNYFLHPPNGSHSSSASSSAGGPTTPRFDANSVMPDPDGPTALVIADADKRRLDNGEPIIVRMDPPCHAVILPDRSMLRFLLRPEAERYLRLRSGLATSAPHAGLADLPVEGSISIAGGLFGKGDEEEALLRATAAAAAAAAADGGADFCLPHPQDLAQELTAAAVAPDDAGSYSAYYTRGPPGNEGLAERMVHMSLEDAAFSLRGSEEMLAAVRKETEVLEKKLGQVVKKNRKMLKEWSKE